MGSKRSWTRGEKWLICSPLLFGIGLVAIYEAPRVWRNHSGYPELLPVKPPYTLHSASLSGDGRYLAAGLHLKSRIGQNEISFWDAKTLEPLAPLTRPVVARGPGIDFYTSCVRFSPDSKLMAWRGTVGDINVCDFNTRKLVWKTRGNYYDVAFSPDSQQIALHSYKRVEIRRARSGKLIASWDPKPRWSEMALSFSPCGKWFASTGPQPGFREYEKSPNSFDKLEIRRTSDWKRIRVLPLTGTSSICFSPDGTRVVGVSRHREPNNSSVSDNMRIACFDVESGALQWEIDSAIPSNKAKFGMLTDTAYSRDGRFVAARNHEKVFLLDATNGKVQQAFAVPLDQQGGTSLPASLAFTPDGKRLFQRGKSALLYWDL